MQKLIASELTVRLLALTILVSGGVFLLAPRAQIAAQAKKDAVDPLDTRFADKVQPILNRYCFKCHGEKKPAAELDLSRDASVKDVVKNFRHWETVLHRLEAKEMPPEDAPRQPTDAERGEVIAWLREVRAREAQRLSNDPGLVLARRLSNAEFDNTIRDLTGVDIRPTREFPVDPANEAGFDNSGESLTMSPALLKKYLAAARHVADHVILLPAPRSAGDVSSSLVFAPYPAVTETDRDKYCVQRIIDFYKRHPVDYSNYFFAAWKYRYRAQFGKADATLAQIAAEAGLSAKYLALVHAALTEPDADIGPVAALRQIWEELPDSADKDFIVRTGCDQLRELTVKLRRQIKPQASKLKVNDISSGSQPMVLWRNREIAGFHARYAGDAAADWNNLSKQLTTDPLTKFFKTKDAAARTKALERFCSVFPATFVVTDRGPYFSPNQTDKGRPLTAGFHLMQGYFRDDAPLYDMVLDEAQRRELDGLWCELNFITLAPMRQYRDFIFFERAEPPRFIAEEQFDFARSEDRDCTSEAKMTKLAKMYLEKATKRRASDEALKAIESYFTSMSAEIRFVEKSRLDAEPLHLEALLKFSERAYRRPLTKAEKDDLLGFYRKLRKEEDLGHEDALRDTLASVLLSPHFCYRIGLPSADKERGPLSDHELASRLSYFLWASMPDAELLSLAAQGELRKPEVLKAQARRMLKDAKVRGLASEFAGNWLDMRRFEEHNAVDRERFPAFTNELRQAMFEEPIRFFMDVAQRDRSVLDLLYSKDTFVNRTLAKHYGMPEVKSATDWVHVADATPYGRGGLLPMAVFLTKNAPGLRTSPVKRGYWVVRRLLGEQIPPPPPTVPELPRDEAKLGELTLAHLLARHRADKACAGCHNRFDAVGLVFEEFGPVGERRKLDLGNRPVQTVALFPDGRERQGLDGLREYLRDKRQGDFTDNLAKKLLSYALSRGLTLADTKTLEAIKARMKADDYRFGSMVEVIITSPQFTHKRGRNES